MDIVKILDDVEDGNISALKAYMDIKREADIYAAALKQIKDAAIDEAEKYGKGEHDAEGGRFQVKNASGKYSYKHIEAWVAANKVLKDLEDGYKKAAQEREKGRNVVTDDGEIVEPADFTPGATTIAILKTK